MTDYNIGKNSGEPQEVRISEFIDDVSTGIRPKEFCKVAKIRGSYELILEPMIFLETTSDVIIQITAEPRMLPLYIVIPVSILFGFMILCIGPLKFAMNTKCCK
jgi:hypothetical protein